MKKKIIVPAIVVLVIALMGYGAYRIMNLRSFQFFGEIIPRVHTNEKVVALTFDDGPTGRTDEILQVLNEAGIKTTFFLNGNSISQNPELARKIAAAGHELGNHTYSHNRMVFKSPAYIKKEIEETNKLIREAGYKEDIHFRPPNGKKLVLLPYYLSKNNIKTIMWNLEPDSYPEIAASEEKIVKYVRDEVQPGSIILLHVMYDNQERKSLESIKDIVTALKDKGYEFKTVSELLEYEKK